MDRLRSWVKETFVYSPLAFAETAESIEQIHQVLALKAGETLAGIGSSGDVLLSFLPVAPGRVLGFDFNPAQTAIACLKVELFRSRDPETYKRLLGLTEASREDRGRIWAELRPALPEHAGMIERLKVRTGILNRGMSAWISRMIDLSLRMNLPRSQYERLMDRSTTREERLEIFEEFHGSALNRYVAGPILRYGRGLFQHFFFPPAQCANSDYPKRALMDAAMLARPMFESGFADNPVVGRHITGRVPTEHERYLFGREAWTGIRENLGHVSFATAAFDQALRGLPARSVDAVYLSNAPDYLKQPGLESFAACVDHVARPGARVFYLSLDTRCPFEAAGVRTPWILDEAKSRDLMSRDPVGVYRYLGAGTVPAGAGREP